MTNQLKTYQPKVLEDPSPEDKELAHACHQKILNLIDQVRASESDLEHGYVSLGKYVYEAQVKCYWIPLGYGSWKEYFSFLEDKFGKGRTSLYGYVGTVKTLSPFVDDETLVEMGVNKARELKRAVDQTGKAPSEELLAKARDPKTDAAAFRQATLEEFHIHDDHAAKGDWFDLKGIYFTEDEREEFLRSVEAAKKTDPVISNSLSWHVQFKEVLLRFAREYWSRYLEYQKQEDEIFH